VEGVGTELEVPDHPDATIRLHKARIKSLSSEVGATQTALKDKCVHPVAAHVQSLSSVLTCMPCHSYFEHRCTEASVSEMLCAVQMATTARGR
jgi:hypothetical protein